MVGPTLISLAGDPASAPEHRQGKFDCGMDSNQQRAGFNLEALLTPLDQLRSRARCKYL